jgi:hypothetical protein
MGLQYPLTIEERVVGGDRLNDSVVVGLTTEAMRRRRTIGRARHGKVGVRWRVNK